MYACIYLRRPVYAMHICMYLQYCMYVFMHVQMHADIYVCAYVCMYYYNNTFLTEPLPWFCVCASPSWGWLSYIVIRTYWRGFYLHNLNFGKLTGSAFVKHTKQWRRQEFVMEGVLEKFGKLLQHLMTFFSLVSKIFFNHVQKMSTISHDLRFF